MKRNLAIRSCSQVYGRVFCDVELPGKETDIIGVVIVIVIVIVIVTIMARVFIRSLSVAVRGGQDAVTLFRRTAI